MLKKAWPHLPIYPADASEHNEEVWEKHLDEIVKCPSLAIKAIWSRAIGLASRLGHLTILRAYGMAWTFDSFS